MSEHACRIDMKHAVSTGFSTRVPKNCLGTEEVLTEFHCRQKFANTRPEFCFSRLPQKAYGKACTEWSTGFLETNYVQLVIKIEPSGIRVTWLWNGLKGLVFQTHSIR